MPTPSSTASFTTPTASTSPATASDADAPPDRAQRIDHQPATLTKIYCQQGARQPGDIISDRRATSSRNQWATSSESATIGLSRISRYLEETNAPRKTGTKQWHTQMVKNILKNHA